jgi:hypothetical protein
VFAALDPAARRRTTKIKYSVPDYAAKYSAPEYAA